MAIELTIEPLGSSKPSSHEIDQSLVTFGRSKSCHVELDYPEVSRRHFIIKFVDDGYVLIDEGSSHGTMLDGQKLTPHTPYRLSSVHEINVPGFVIQFVYDGNKPKLERTTVVARKLLDELLQGEALTRDCSVLQDLLGYHAFSFSEDKTSFSLGSSPQGDFVVKDDLVAKRHASFVRDIHGISVIPLPGNDVFIDNILITEPKILTHGVILKVGTTEFVFKDRAKIEPPKADESPSNQTITPEFSKPMPTEPQKVTPVVPTRSLMGTLDRVFVVAFFLVVACASAMFFELI